MSETKQITIRRERGFYGILRKSIIRVDDVEVLRIKSGETHSLKLPAGAQSVHMQMDWLHTDPLDLAEIQEGETLVIRVEKRSFREMSQLNSLPFLISIER